jgi:DNA-binding NarL/FixJ family response regulator
MRRYSKVGRKIFDILLTKHQSRIAKMVCESGLGLKQIAYYCGTSEGTVKTQLSGIYDTLDTHSLQQLMLLYWTVA